MKRRYDLFHQHLYTTPEGFIVVADYTGMNNRTVVYTPYGEYCGESGASSMLTIKADVRQIVKYRIEWEQMQR